MAPRSIKDNIHIDYKYFFSRRIYVKFTERLIKRKAAGS